MMALSCASSPAADGPENGENDNGNGSQEKIPGALVADGNDEGTYDLIVSSGYNYETPDRSGAHASAPFRHIRQSFDAELDKYVFDFILHIDNDDDRGKPDVTDRQRNEIKTDAKSPDSMVAKENETIRNTWKFRLPEGMQTTTGFSHIHQLKGIDNASEDADVSMPLITFTVRSLTGGGQQFQVIYVGPSSEDTGNVYLAKTDLSDFLGEWVEVTETVCCSLTDGTYDLVIRRVSDRKELVRISKPGLHLWREGTTGIRPKWGLYRSIGKEGINKNQLRDETLKFADFMIEKLD